MNRRDFINKVGRSGIFLGIAAVAGFALFKSSTQDVEACAIQPVCSGCKKMNNCSKPQALKAKENGQ